MLYAPGRLLSPIAGGVPPTLDLNFLGGAMPDGITFTRASTALSFNSAGTLTSAATNVPRLDYNPATLQPRGLLIEEARTNLLTYSAEFDNAAWTKSVSTVTANSTTAPDGTLTADTLVDAATTAEHVMTSANITWAGNTQYTLSVHVKAGTLNYIRLLFSTAGNWVNSSRSCFFDLTNGTVVGTPAAPLTASITSAGSGWYRCSITATTVASPSASSVNIALANTSSNTTFAGAGTNTLFLWGAMLEAGAFPTSYIPTTTAAATRAADVATINPLGSWFNGSTGTVFAEFSVFKSNPTTVQYPVALDDGTAQNLMSIYNDSSAQIVALIIASSVTGVQTVLATGAVTGTVYKAALAYKVNDVAGAVNGGTVAADTSNTIPTVTKMVIGNRTDGVRPLNGYIRRIRVHDRRLPNAVLQVLTS